MHMQKHSKKSLQSIQFSDCKVTVITQTDSTGTHISFLVLVREGQLTGEALSEHLQSSGLHALN